MPGLTMVVLCSLAKEKRKKRKKREKRKKEEVKLRRKISILGFIQYYALQLNLLIRTSVLSTSSKCLDLLIC
jgi:hypothetical protein